MSKKISQREARRLRARVRELEEEKKHRANQYRKDYPGGVYLVGGIKLVDYCNGIICGAQRSGRALVARYNETSRELTIYGVEQ